MRRSVMIMVAATLAATVVVAAWMQRPKAFTQIQVGDIASVEGIGGVLTDFFPAVDEEGEPSLPPSVRQDQTSRRVVERPTWMGLLPETLGVANSSDRAVAGFRYPVDAWHDPVYMAVLLRSDGAGSWEITSATTVCDPFGKGVVVSFDTDPGLVVVLGGSGPGTAHVGSGIDLVAGRPVMQVFEMPGLSPQYHVLAVDHRRPAKFCSR